MKTILNKTGLCTLLIVCCFNASAITNALKIKLINGSKADETVVRFLSNATPGFDGSCDAYKMFSSSPQAVFTSIGPEKYMAVNAQPVLLEPTSVELYTQVNAAGTYTLQAFEIGTFAEGAKIILEDKETGKSHYFRNGSSISVTIAANTIATANRFVLHFTPVTNITTGIAEETAQDPIRVYIQDGSIMLNVQMPYASAMEIAVYTIGGQRVYYYANNQVNSVSENIALNTGGVYIVNFIIDGKANSQKINFIK